MFVFGILYLAFFVRKNNFSREISTIDGKALTVDSQIDKISSFTSIATSENQFLNGQNKKFCFGFQ